MWTLRCNTQTLQLGRKALTCVPEEKQVALARAVNLKKPEIRYGRWKTTLGRRYVVSVESKAVSDPAKTPCRDGHAPPRRPAARQPETESAPSDRGRSDHPGFRPLHLPGLSPQRGQAQGRFGHLRPTAVFLLRPCQLTAVWEREA